MKRFEERLAGVLEKALEASSEETMVKEDRVEVDSKKKSMT